MITAEPQTAHVACFQRKLKLSVFSAYPDSSPSQLIRVSEVLLYSSLKTDKSPRTRDPWGTDPYTAARTRRGEDQKKPKQLIAAL